MDGILSQEPTVARHALALALHLAQHNAPQLLESQKDLTTVVAATCSMYEASGKLCSKNSEIPMYIVPVIAASRLECMSLGQAASPFLSLVLPVTGLQRIQHCHQAV